MAKATSPRKPRQTPASTPATAPATTVAATPATAPVAPATQPQPVLVALPPATLRPGTASHAAYLALHASMGQTRAVAMAAALAAEAEWAARNDKQLSKSANAAGWLRKFGAVFGTPTTQAQVSA